MRIPYSKSSALAPREAPPTAKPHSYRAQVVALFDAQFLGPQKYIVLTEHKLFAVFDAQFLGPQKYIVLPRYICEAPKTGRRKARELVLGMMGFCRWRRLPGC